MQYKLCRVGIPSKVGKKESVRIGIDKFEMELTPCLSTTLNSLVSSIIKDDDHYTIWKVINEDDNAN